ncbi:MAG: hypothetical protein ACRDAX_00080 [Propionibacteriaceae bacterium]
MQEESDNNHNKIALHAQKYNHDIDFEGTKIIAHQPHYRKRRVTEAVAMLCQTNAFSKPSATINPIWHSLINEHGKGYFKEKSTLPINTTKCAAPTSNKIKPPTATNNAPTNNAPKNMLHARVNRAGDSAASTAVRAQRTPSHTYKLRPRVK